MPDSIDKWRRLTSKPQPVANDDSNRQPPAPPPADQTEEKENDFRLRRFGIIELRPVGALTSEPNYGQLIDVLTDGVPMSFLVLWFYHQLVVITGRNLESYASSLRTRTCWRIEQYDPKSGPPPARDEPVVESMKFYYGDISARVDALRRGESPRPKGHPLPARAQRNFSGEPTMPASRSSHTHEESP